MKHQREYLILVAALLMGGCTSMANTGISGISFGMSPQDVIKNIHSTDTVVESTNTEIVSVGPSDKGDIRRKTFTFIDGRLKCVKHQFVDKNGQLRKSELNVCE